jgi:hypothetical protein
VLVGVKSGLDSGVDLDLSLAGSGRQKLEAIRAVFGSQRDH